MENQKKVNPMTAEQYFALRCEIIRSINFKEMECCVFAAVGLVFMSIGAMSTSPNSGLSILGGFVTIAMVCLLLVLRRSKNERLDRLRIEYSRGASFEYVATIKLNLMEDKIKEPRFTPGACECQ